MRSWCKRTALHSFASDNLHYSCSQNENRQKLREVKARHDGTWVAHPGLVGLAKEIFDEFMPGPNQISNLRKDVHITADDLLRVPEGDITEAGLDLNIDAPQQAEAYVLVQGQSSQSESMCPSAPLARPAPRRAALNGIRLRVSDTGLNAN